MLALRYRAFRWERYFALGMKEDGRLEFIDTNEIKRLEQEGHKVLVWCKDPEKAVLKKVRLPHRLQKLTAPLFVVISLTNRCNLQCKHCAQPKEFEGELSTKEWKEIISDLKKTGVFGVVITGGEPLVRTDILEILHYAVDVGLEVHLKTNGTLIDRNFARSTPDPPYFSLSLSLDGWEETHDAVRGEGSFARLMKAVELLEAERDKRGLNFALNYTVMEGNVQSLNTALDFCLSHNIKLFFELALPLGKMVQDRFLSAPEDEEIEILLEAWKRRVFHFITTTGRRKRGMLLWSSEAFHPLFGGCGAARALCAIAPNGNVYPCIDFYSLGIYKMGNVTREAFASIWNDSAAADEVRRRTFDDFEECKSCEIADICNFKCPALSYALTGELTRCGATQAAKKLYTKVKEEDLIGWKKELRRKVKGE